MKKYLILCLMMIPLLLLSFVLPKTTGPDPLSKMPADTSFNLLAMYGEYVFGREGCIRCHVLVDNTVPKKISLDGLKGKYPSEWHYNHLVNPGLMVPDSWMPSYRQLVNHAISYSKLAELYKKHTGASTVPDSSTLNTLVQRGVLEVRETYYSAFLTENNYDNTEIMALICWLQQIKPSASKQISDSLRTEKVNREYANKLYLWKAWIRDPQSRFFQIAGSKMKHVLDKGGKLFQRYCAICHGSLAQGKIGPNLTDEYWLDGNSIEELATTIRFGHQAMPPWEQALSPEQISQLIAYIRSLKGSNPPDPKAPQGEKKAN